MECSSPEKKPKGKNVLPLFSTKYSADQLNEILTCVQSFKINDVMPEYIQPETESKARSYLGNENKIALSNAQQIINQQQNLKGQLIVFDTRSAYNYHLSHFENSISFPVCKCRDDFFIKWDPKYISEHIIKNKFKKKLFENRKRVYVYIIASQNDITHFLEKLPRLCSAEAIKEYFGKYENSSQVLENLISIRNAILLYKALKNERIREIYLCVNGFKTFKQKYPFFCKFKTSYLYAKNYFAPTYPSEILDNRLYLGDCNHAQDKTILQNLKITHILNVSNNIPNYFEDDFEMDIEYLRINIEDNSSVPIKLSFPVAFQFIENSFNETHMLKRDKSKRNNALVDDYVMTQKELRDQIKNRLNSAALLAPIYVDFKGNKSHCNPTREEIVAYKIDQQIDAFNRISYNNNVVFVHCAMGVSRSASCVIMTIMKKFKIGFKDTLEFVKNKRHVVDPNEGFVKQLQEFELNKMKFANEQLPNEEDYGEEECESPTEIPLKAASKTRNPTQFMKRGRTEFFE